MFVGLEGCHCACGLEGKATPMMRIMGPHSGTVGDGFLAGKDERGISR